MTAHISLTGTTIDRAIDIAGTHGNTRLAVHITGITTAIDVTANGNLCLSRHGAQEHH